MPKNTRTIRRPEGFDSHLKGYFMIANQDAAIAITKKLTGTQLRLWLYLMMIDSFADLTSSGEKIYHEIPSPLIIAAKIGCSPGTVEKDMRVLGKLGLYEYRITSWQGHNLSAAKARQESENLKKKKAEPKSQQSFGLNNPSQGLNNPSQGLNNPSQGLNNPSEGLNSPSAKAETIEKPWVSDRSQTIQTYTDSLSDSDSERENFSCCSTKSPPDDKRENFDDRATKPTKKPAPQTYRKFIQELSVEEREKFLNFVRKKTENFNPAIVCLDDYLASKDRWQGLYKEFRAVVSRTTGAHAKPKRRGNPLAARIDRMVEEARKREEQEKANKEVASSAVLTSNR